MRPADGNEYSPSVFRAPPEAIDIGRLRVESGDRHDGHQPHRAAG